MQRIARVGRACRCPSTSTAPPPCIHFRSFHLHPPSASASPSDSSGGLIYTAPLWDSYFSSSSSNFNTPRRQRQQQSWITRSRTHPHPPPPPSSPPSIVPRPLSPSEITSKEEKEDELLLLDYLAGGTRARKAVGLSEKEKEKAFSRLGRLVRVAQEKKLPIVSRLLVELSTALVASEEGEGQEKEEELVKRLERIKVEEVLDDVINKGDREVPLPASLVASLPLQSSTTQLSTLWTSYSSLSTTTFEPSSPSLSLALRYIAFLTLPSPTSPTPTAHLPLALKALQSLFSTSVPSSFLATAPSFQTKTDQASTVQFILLRTIVSISVLSENFDVACQVLKGIVELRERLGVEVGKEGEETEDREEFELLEEVVKGVTEKLGTEGSNKYGEKRVFSKKKHSSTPLPDHLFSLLRQLLPLFPSHPSLSPYLSSFSTHLTSSRSLSSLSTLYTLSPLSLSPKSRLHLLRYYLALSPLHSYYPSKTRVSRPAEAYELAKETLGLVKDRKLEMEELTNWERSTLVEVLCEEVRTRNFAKEFYDWFSSTSSKDSTFSLTSSSFLSLLRTTVTGVDLKESIKIREWSWKLVGDFRRSKDLDYTVINSKKNGVKIRVKNRYHRKRLEKFDYTTLSEAYWLLGSSDHVVKLYTRMNKEGLRPDKKDVALLVRIVAREDWEKAIELLKKFGGAGEEEVEEGEKSGEDLSRDQSSSKENLSTTQFSPQLRPRSIPTSSYDPPNPYLSNTSDRPYSSPTQLSQHPYQTPLSSSSSLHQTSPSTTLLSSTSIETSLSSDSVQIETPTAVERVGEKDIKWLRSCLEESLILGLKSKGSSWWETARTQVEDLTDETKQREVQNWLDAIGRQSTSLRRILSLKSSNDNRQQRSLLVGRIQEGIKKRSWTEVKKFYRFALRHGVLDPTLFTSVISSLLSSIRHYPHAKTSILPSLHEFISHAINSSPSLVGSDKLKELVCKSLVLLKDVELLKEWVEKEGGRVEIKEKSWVAVKGWVVSELGWEVGVEVMKGLEKRVEVEM